MELKEKTRKVGAYQSWTDTLDPNGKPYLVHDLLTNTFHVLYWRAWFRGPIWTGSNWYKEYPSQDDMKPDHSSIKRLDSIKVYELPGIQYAPSETYTHKEKV